LFVLAAKANAQPPERIVDSFVIAWNRNATRTDRWKLLSKIAERGAIVNERVVKAVIESPNPREWEVFLGHVLDMDGRECFEEWWREAGGPRVDLLSSDVEWDQVRRLLRIALKNQPYIKGDIS
jgi:hypothetical protein